MTTVSTRTLRDELSTYLRRAEGGERIVVMRGSKAVAALVPLEANQDLDEEAKLRELEARGLVVLPTRSSPAPFTGPRVPSRGRSASAMVIEDRE